METFSALLTLCVWIHWWTVNSPHKASDAEFWCFLWSALEQTIWDWVNNRDVGDLRRHHVSVMIEKKPSNYSIFNFLYGGPHNHLGYVFILDKISYLNILASRGRKIGTFSHCCEIWEAHRQHCCGGASQILERSNSSEYKISRLRDFARSYNKSSYRILKPGPGPVSIYRPSFPGMGIPMLKIRRSVRSSYL